MPGPSDTVRISACEVDPEYVYDTPFDGPGQVLKEKKEDSSSNSKQTESTSSMGSKDGLICSAIKKRFNDLAKTMWKPLKKKQDTDWRCKQKSSSDDSAVSLDNSLDDHLDNPKWRREDVGRLS